MNNAEQLFYDAPSPLAGPMKHHLRNIGFMKSWRVWVFQCLYRPYLSSLPYRSYFRICMAAALDCVTMIGIVSLAALITLLLWL
ncbi:MAG: hypothetical protein CR984_02260 [Proteobacteria bacterium]|nr:MAG: hypothetical protein CR984_02260 [Pseudomonadota bacterium]PIE67842.1 MAG: hypothetical protein CSA23_01815 [Deltaproteobacteria bacterium]